MEAESQLLDNESIDESEESLVEKGWGVVTPNSAILVYMLFGVVGTLAEVAGYWPAISLKTLFPEINEEEIESELKKAIYKIYDVVNLINLYSVHIYLATYILLPYPLLMERQRILLAPWLLCGVVRSILLNLLLSLGGVILCSTRDKVHYQCLLYSALKGVEFCTSMFLWTSVHSFYHVLDKRKSVKSFDKVLKTIHKASIRKARNSPEKSPDSPLTLSVDSLYEELDDGNEGTLVERAAMAWIAREILEDDGEYVSDSQFSQYLALKATMELRQIVNEMAEKKRERKRCSYGRTTMAERIRESLEFVRKNSTPRSSLEEEPLRAKLEAFDQSEALSKRDPLRRIPPLVHHGKPLADDEDSIELDSDVLSLMEPWQSYSASTTSIATNINVMKKKKALRDTKEPPNDVRLPAPDQFSEDETAPVLNQAVVMERTVEVQTDPLSPQMIQLFNVLDQCTKLKRSRDDRYSDRKTREKNE